MRREGPQGLAAEMRALAQAARDASRSLGHAPTARKDDALRFAADALGRRARKILAENARDL
jgi:glutamate-5-semialdehyde dehydrogenase